MASDVDTEHVKSQLEIRELEQEIEEKSDEFEENLALFLQKIPIPSNFTSQNNSLVLQFDCALKTPLCWYPEPFQIQAQNVNLWLRVAIAAVNSGSTGDSTYHFDGLSQDTLKSIRKCWQLHNDDNSSFKEFVQKGFLSSKEFDDLLEECNTQNLFEQLAFNDILMQWACVCCDREHEREMASENPTYSMIVRAAEELESYSRNNSIVQLPEITEDENSEDHEEEGEEGEGINFTSDISATLGSVKSTESQNFLNSPSNISRVQGESTSSENFLALPLSPKSPNSQSSTTSSDDVNTADNFSDVSPVISPAGSQKSEFSHRDIAFSESVIIHPKSLNINSATAGSPPKIYSPTSPQSPQDGSKVKMNPQISPMRVQGFNIPFKTQDNSSNISTSTPLVAVREAPEDTPPHELQTQSSFKVIKLRSKPPDGPSTTTTSDSTHQLKTRPPPPSSPKKPQSLSRTPDATSLKFSPSPLQKSGGVMLSPSSYSSTSQASPSLSSRLKINTQKGDLGDDEHSDVDDELMSSSVSTDVSLNYALNLPHRPTVPPPQVPRTPPPPSLKKESKKKKKKRTEMPQRVSTAPLPSSASSVQFTKTGDGKDDNNKHKRHASSFCAADSQKSLINNETPSFLKDESKENERIPGMSVPMVGWLHKKNPGGMKGMRMWKRRWCVIEGHEMQYFGKPEDIDPKGTIDFSRVLEVDRVSKNSKHESRFQIVLSKSQRVFEFKADTKDACDQWIAALQRNLSKSNIAQSV